MVNQLNRQMAERLINEIRLHNIDYGGTTMLTTGAKGGGKTHFLIKLASQIAYLNPSTGKPIQETIIWRGRSPDYWNHLLYDDFESENTIPRTLRLHIHTSDNAIIESELNTTLPIPDTHIYPYKDISELYHNLLPGGFNVVYEPRVYQISRKMQQILLSRACTRAATLDGITWDPAIWWIELMIFISAFKRAGFISLFIDECEEVLPANPPGLRWHLNSLFADSMKDFRKNNISMYASCHHIGDVDYRLRSKFQYAGYTKGARTAPGSLIHSKALLTANVGTVYLERDGWGTLNMGALHPHPRVKVEFPAGFHDLAAWCTAAETLAPPSLQPQPQDIKEDIIS